jgi:hypothetical protein
MLKHLLVIVAISGALTIPALADYVDPDAPQESTMPDVITPWDAVVASYRQAGYTESSFQNRYGNTWNVWTAASGNTLIWSKTNAGGRGEGFNCLADSRPNTWASCQRYELTTGQPTGHTPLAIRNGVVIDNRGP